MSCGYMAAGKPENGSRKVTKMGFIVKSLAIEAVVALAALHFAHRFGYVALVVVAFFTFGAVISWAEKRAS